MVKVISRMEGYNYNSPFCLAALMPMKEDDDDNGKIEPADHRTN